MLRRQGLGQDTQPDPATVGDGSGPISGSDPQRNRLELQTFCVGGFFVRRPYIERFDWRISDVVKATGLDYHLIRRALLRGELRGIRRPRLLRTNEAAVSDWLASMQASRRSRQSSPHAKPKGRKLRHGHTFTHLDPDKAGG